MKGKRKKENEKNKGSENMLKKGMRVMLEDEEELNIIERKDWEEGMMKIIVKDK